MMAAAQAARSHSRMRLSRPDLLTNGRKSDIKQFQLANIPEGYFRDICRDFLLNMGRRDEAEFCQQCVRPGEDEADLAAADLQKVHAHR